MDRASCITVLVKKGMITQFKTTKPVLQGYINRIINLWLKEVCIFLVIC